MSCQMVSSKSPSCDSGQRQTMNYIVDTCLLTEFEGGLNLLHKMDDDAVIWRESTATTAVTKMIIIGLHQLNLKL